MTDQIIIQGGKPLNGEITVSGAKNAVLPILAATLLSSDICRIREVPHLADVKAMVSVMESMGAKVMWEGNDLLIDPSNMEICTPNEEATKEMRASVLILGPLASRLGQASLTQPGGCAIGARPIDIHLKGFEALGAKVETVNGVVSVSAEQGLVGSRIYMDFPSVGATENLMMAAVFAKGETILENAAEEPEIVDLANFINSMGGKIRGAGTKQIKIKGVEALTGGDHQVIPDRIEAGSYLIACAMAGGKLTLKNVITDHIRPLIAKLIEAGCKIEEGDTEITILSPEKLKAQDVKTLPYPGFPTDLQAQYMALMTVADGTSVVTETVFENRFKHAEELRNMGADIRVSGQMAIVHGPVKLKGTKVQATDLRAGAALVIAALAAEGETRISNVHFIDRGYDDLVGKLSAVGADIRRTE